jgi:hypothetical protein
MSNNYRILHYQTLLDDAQMFIGMANKRLDEAKDIMMKSGHPGIMFASTNAKKIMFKLIDCSTEIDQLPADFGDGPGVSDHA